MPKLIETGSELRALREKLGLSRIDFAPLLGIKRDGLLKIEKDKCRMSMSVRILAFIMGNLENGVDLIRSVLPHGGDTK